MIGGDGSNVVPSPPLSCCSASGWNNVYNDVNSHSSIVHYFQLANDLQQLAFNNNLMTQLIQLRYHQNIMQTSQHILEQHHDSFPLRNFTMSPSLNNNYSQDLPIQHAVRCANPWFLSTSHGTRTVTFSSWLQSQGCRLYSDDVPRNLRMEEDEEGGHESCPSVS